jgi:hypothetical protein
MDLQTLLVPSNVPVTLTTCSVSERLPYTPQYKGRMMQLSRPDFGYAACSVIQRGSHSLIQEPHMVDSDHTAMLKRTCHDC